MYLTFIVRSFHLRSLSTSTTQSTRSPRSHLVWRVMTAQQFWQLLRHQLPAITPTVRCFLLTAKTAATTAPQKQNIAPSQRQTIRNMCTNEQQLRNYYNYALELVLECGPVMREGYDNNKNNFKTKSAFFDLVTIYDKKIEDMLIAGLQKEFPESKFIGEEESAERKQVAELTDAPTWIIDPIDGTTNFIHRIPHCCISVGLAINKELVLGIVYNPIANEMYSAWKGHGAYLNGQRIAVSKCTHINDAVLGYEISLIHAPAVRDKNVKRLCKLASNSTGTRGMGSAALMLCYVACGSFDCFHVEDLAPWDIAAGAVIVREAGGVIYHTKGGEFNIMKPDLVCAATQDLVKDMMRLINEANEITEYTFT